MTDTTPGWQPDPSGKHDHRYWDGSQWTDHISDGGVAGTDPYDAPVDAPADAPDPADAPTVTDAPAVAATGDEGWAQPSSDAPAPDTTAAWPTAGAPAPPPPYVPPSPVSGGDGGTGGSKRGLLIGGAILAVVAIVAAVLLLGGDDETDARTELASRLQAESDGELDDEQADCVAGYFADAIGDDDLDEIDFDAEEPPAVFLEALQEIDLVEMTDDCGLDPATFGTDTTEPSDDGGTDDTDDGGAGEGESYGDDPELDALYDGCEAGDFADCDQLYLDSPFDSEYEEFGSTCGGIADQQYGSCETTDGGQSSGGGFSDGGALPDNFEEILADTYESSLGLERAKAECLAGKLAEVIESGEISEDEAMTEIFGYLSECDISMSEIGAN
jgi:hypothetical protein